MPRGRTGTSQNADTGRRRSVANRLEELTARVKRFGEETADVGEPWRGGITAILSQLQLALESFAALREVTAEGILDRADNLVSAQLTIFRREVLPTCPQGVSEAAVFDRKADLIRILDLALAGECFDAISEIAREALQDRDQLTLYCLASGPLDFYYRARRLSRDAVRERLLELSGRGKEADVLQRLVGPQGVAALLGDVRRSLRDPTVTMELEAAILKPKLDLNDLAPLDGSAEDSEEMRQMEEEYRRVAAMANKLSGQQPGPQPNQQAKQQPTKKK